MKSKISVLYQKAGEYRTEIPEIFKFPGGELQVKFKQHPDRKSPCTVSALIKDSDGFMALALLKNILDMEQLEDVRLLLHYVPYARQDRVCAAHEALSAKVFANLINSLNFSQVFVEDPHSDVTPALINGCKVITQAELFMLHPKKDFLSTLTLVSPDAGANKKTLELASKLGHTGFIRADKIRNTFTGEITGTEVYGDVEGKRLLIVDDICDGGGTFILLSNELKKKGAKSVALYVTHGIFSKGKQVLYDAGINYIACHQDWTLEV